MGRGDTGGDIGDVDVERIWNLKNSRKSTPGIQTAFVTVIMPVFQTKVPLWTRSWGRLGLLPSSSLAWLDGVYLRRDAHAGEAGLGVIPAVPRLVWSRLTPPDPVTFSPAVMPQSGHISLSRKHVISASLLPLIHVQGGQRAFVGSNKHVPTRRGCRGLHASWPLTACSSPGEECGPSQSREDSETSPGVGG